MEHHEASIWKGLCEAQIQKEFQKIPGCFGNPLYRGSFAMPLYREGFAKPRYRERFWESPIQRSLCESPGGFEIPYISV